MPVNEDMTLDNELPGAIGELERQRAEIKPLHRAAQCLAGAQNKPDRLPPVAGFPQKLGERLA